MAFSFTLLPDGELFDVVCKNGEIFINDEHLTIDKIPNDGEFTRHFIETDEQMQRAYAVHSSEFFEGLPYAVVEFIYQAVARLAEGRTMIEEFEIDLDKNCVRCEGFEKMLPVDEFKSWDARSALKDLIYS